MTDAAYVGSELELFAEATNWKAYYRSMIRPFFGRRVLEVGAGIGRTATALCDGDVDRWLCLEPDAGQVREIDRLRASGELPACCESFAGTLETLAPEEVFDAVLYIDVLEHIEDDAAEARRAAERLVPGGHLVVVGPAHGWLYTPFDEAIGHHRRYTRASLEAAVPAELTRARLRYLDAVGLLASLGNRLVLAQSLPTRRQLWIWDKWMVPCSRLLDPLFGYRLGKSVVGVWQRAAVGRKGIEPPARV